MSWKRTYLVFFLLLIASAGQAQLGYGYFPYRGTVADPTGALLPLTNIEVRTTIYETSSPTTLYLEETHTTQTDSFGLYDLVIGNGTPTGNAQYTTAENIPFNAVEVSMLIEINVNGIGYETINDGVLWAVPYALHSKTVATDATMNFHVGLNTTGLQNGYILVWDGTNWTVGDRGLVQTAMFAWNAGNTAYADTVAVGYSPVALNADTVLFAYLADTALFAQTAINATYVDSVNGATEAGFATEVYNWKTIGNTTQAGDYVGTEDFQPIVFKTNGAEHMRFSEDGKWHIGVVDSVADLYVHHIDGVHWDSIGPASPWVSPGNGDWIVWSPLKSTFAGGATTDTLWDATNVGKFNFIYGRNSWARGNYSQAFGDSCWVVGEPHPYNLSPGNYSFAIGKHSQANGNYSFGGGLRSSAKTTRSVAIGKDCVTPGGYACVALGNNANADGIFEPATAIGTNIHASGKFSTGMGYNVDLGLRRGSFMYGDYSPNDTLRGLSAYRFVARASGGTIFYSNSFANSGVYTLPGGGAWNSVSDRTKKHNIQTVDGNSITNRIALLKISNWNYTAQPGVLHIGPMAQDFYSAFQVGESDTTITTTDIDGVIMSGIQEVNQQLNQTDKKIEDINASATAPEYKSLDQRLDAIEQRIQSMQQEKKCP